MQTDTNDTDKRNATSHSTRKSKGDDSQQFTTEFDLEQEDTFEVVLERTNADEWSAYVNCKPSYGEHAGRTPGDALRELADQFGTAIDTPPVATDGGRVQALTKTEVSELRQELTKFQIRILEILAEEDRYGLAIKRGLEDYYGTEVNHGRLYPNLDELVGLELVEKGELDKRTNNYTLTGKGQAFLEDDLEWQDERVNGGDEA